VQRAQDDLVTVKTTANLPDFPDRPRLRRWDGVDDAETIWTLLEDGIEVQFEAGTYLPGDYWLIPARSATGDVDWPKAGGLPSRSRGVELHTTSASWRWSSSTAGSGPSSRIAGRGSPHHPADEPVLRRG